MIPPKGDIPASPPAAPAPAAPSPAPAPAAPSPAAPSPAAPSPAAGRPALLPGVALGLALALSLALHLRALARVPMEAFGAAGGAYVPHMQRALGDALLASGAWDAWPPWRPLIQLEGHYGGLLHVIAAHWGRLEPSGGQLAALPWAAHLSWGALALTALGAAALGRRLGLSHGAAALGGMLTLALPGLFGPAQRYYYDLPMTAALLGSAALLVGDAPPGRRGALRLAAGALCAALALHFKWAAALYLLPIALLHLWAAPGGRLWRAALGLAIPLALTAPLLIYRGGSLDFQLGLLGEGPISQGASMAEALYTYVWALAIDGAGPLVALPALALAPFVGRRAGIPLGLLVGIPLALLPLLAPAADGRYVLPLLPFVGVFVAAGAFGLGARLAPRARSLAALPGAILLVGAGLQLARVEGILWPLPPRDAAEVWAGQPAWRQWWYAGGRLAQGAPLAEDLDLALLLLDRCPPGPIHVRRDAPRDLPAHPLRYWMERLGGAGRLYFGDPGQGWTWPAEGACVLNAAAPPYAGPALVGEILRPKGPRGAPLSLWMGGGDTPGGGEHTGGAP